VETGGKLTIVGVYNNLIGFPLPVSSQGLSPKIAIPQLCVFNRWKLDHGVRQTSVTEIFDPKEVSRGRIVHDLLPATDGGDNQEILKFFGIVFDIFDATYSVRIRCGNFSYETRFMVKIGDSPTLQ
jgi:hypothetical protein